MMTIEDCMKAAWQALLKGDRAGRDRYIALAKNLMNARDRAISGEPIIKGEAIRIPDQSKARP